MHNFYIYMKLLSILIFYFVILLPLSSFPGEFALLVVKFEDFSSIFKWELDSMTSSLRPFSIIFQVLCETCTYQTHVFLSTSNNNVRGPCLDGLRTKGDSLQSWATHHVDTPGRHMMRDPRVHTGLTRTIHALAYMKYVEQTMTVYFRQYQEKNQSCTEQEVMRTGRTACSSSCLVQANHETLARDQPKISQNSLKERWSLSRGIINTGMHIQHTACMKVISEDWFLWRWPLTRSSTV